MKKKLSLYRVALAALSCSIGSCGTRVIEINADRCWNGRINSGDNIFGSAYLYYFPNTKTFLKNGGCPKEVIGVAAGSDPSFFEKYDHDISSKGDMSGLKIKVELRGHVSENGEGDLIFIEKMTAKEKGEYIHF
jgi:hypothetical protein